jgi:hypothetical protein
MDFSLECAEQFRLFHTSILVLPTIPCDIMAQAKSGGHLPRKTKLAWDFPPEIRAIWHAAPNLTLCPKFRRASMEKLLAHIKNDKCERCLAVYQQLNKESDLICFLARRGEFSVVLVAAFDRIARSTKNFLEIVDELGSVNIEFVSAREAIDTSGPMGRMFLTMVGSIAELERSLIVERIKAGMRRAKMEGRTLGRAPLNVDRKALVRDRLAGMSLTDGAKKYRISRASVVRVVRDAKQRQLVAAA